MIAVSIAWWHHAGAVPIIVAAIGVALVGRRVGSAVLDVVDWLTTPPAEDVRGDVDRSEIAAMQREFRR